MALSATIFKVDLQIADMDRGYYGDHHLTVARHPSETDERMMVRLLAFGLHASEHLQFTKGLCADAEPELWQKSLSGAVDVWIDVGLPDEKRIRKACRQAGEVHVYAYGGGSARIWWQRVRNKVNGLSNLGVVEFPESAIRVLAERTERTMRLQLTVQDGQIWLGNSESTVTIEAMRRYP